MTAIRLATLITLLATLAAVVGAPALQAQDAQEAANELRQAELLKNMLRTKTLDVDFDETPLGDAIAYIRARTGINIVLDPRAAEDHKEDAITLTIKNLTVAAVLNIMLDFVDLKYTFRHGVVWVTTPEEAYKGLTILRFYDVRDLTFKIKDFPGTKIRLRGNEDGGGGGPVWEDEDPVAEPIEIDQLEEIIPEFCSPDSWDQNPEATIVQLAGILIIRQSVEVHKEIAHLLAQLRANR